jgi:hypothetical protein
MSFETLQLPPGHEPRPATSPEYLRCASPFRVKLPAVPGTKALNRVEVVQKRTKVKPDILYFSRDARRLFLVDRSLLFYRTWGPSTQWPWDEEEDETLF